MNKIKFVDNTEQEITLCNVSSNGLMITFVNLIDYSALVALQTKFTRDNLVTLLLYQDDMLTGEYKNFIKVENAINITNNEDGSINATITFNKETIENKFLYLEEKFNEKFPTYNISDMTLEELKEYLILLTKCNLEDYLENNHIISSAHTDTQEYYSITKEKQTLLGQMILITQIANDSNIPYTPSWNAYGKPCTYDWTLSELKQLAFEIEAVIRPLVSKQQTIEAMIRSATTKEEVLAIELNFSTDEIEEAE